MVLEMFVYNISSILPFAKNHNKRYIFGIKTTIIT